MKVLFITSDYYPDFGTTVNIFKKLFFDGLLVDKVDKIGVLTVKRQYDAADYEIIDGIHVYRALSWRLISKTEFSRALKKISLFEAGRISLLKSIYKVKSLIKANPLIRKDNVRAFVNEMKKINADEYDILVPIFGNHDTAEAAMQFASNRTKIVLYQVDPCSTNWGRPKSEQQFTIDFERKMYTKADAIITMDVIFEDVKKIFPNELLSKFHPVELPLVVPPKVREEVAFTQEDGAICLFSGLIYLGIRDPSYTLKLFRKLIYEKKVSLHFVGVRKDELPEAFQDLPIVCYGKVDMNQAQKLINGSDILVNIGNLMNNQIPSKIFDYISIGKPIVNVCKNRICPTLPYLEKYRLAINLFEEDDLLETQQSQLESFIANNIGEKVNIEEIEGIYRSCTPEYCANLLLDIFNKLLD